MIAKAIIAAYGVFSLCVGMFVGSTMLQEDNPTPEMTCPYGATEDSCKPDFVGKGKWRLLPNS